MVNCSIFADMVEKFKKIKYNFLYWLENKYNFKSYYACERNDDYGDYGGTEIYGKLTGKQYQ